MDAKKLELYAEFAVRTAVNVQKGQNLVIDCPIEAAYFARMCAEKAYAAGARDVVVHYGDERVDRIRMQHGQLAVLEDVKPWYLGRYMEYEADPQGVCRLAISARDPEIFKGLDTDKIEKATQARSKALKPWRELLMGNKRQWSILSVPSAAWARKVMGEGMPEDEAVEKLWEAIFAVCRVDGGDPVAAWERHAQNSLARVEKLNALKLDALHMKAANGTDLVLGLPEDYLFAGVREDTEGGVPFLANVPTEEVFSAPHCRRVDGVVKSSMPYVYNGNIIEGITATFKDGLVVKATAEKGQELLDQLLSADEGARRLGEIALVPASSPIRKTGLLFYNTLFDENAACHIAFGAAYPNSVKGGAAMSTEQQAEKGLNDSLIHEDVMVGTEDMDIVGTLKNGEKVQIFKGGEWAI